MVKDPKNVKTEFWKNLLDKASGLNLKLVENKASVVAFENQTALYTFQFDKAKNQWCGKIEDPLETEVEMPFVGLNEAEWFCMVLTFLNAWCRRK